MNNGNLSDLQQEAIKAAIAKKWQEAVSLNQQILEIIPSDTATLNRLGIAHSMNGESKQAAASFQAVLDTDPHNQIAKNNLRRLKINKKQGLVNPSFQTVSFIEEPGKSKVVPLVNQGEPTVFSSLNIGEPVDLLLSKHKVKVVKGKSFLGYLPDNISHRLVKLLTAGYKYSTIVKSINAKNPQVFIQEIKTSKKLRGVPSFPLDDMDHLPSLSAGESSETPPLEIYDPLLSDE